MIDRTPFDTSVYQNHYKPKLFYDIKTYPAKERIDSEFVIIVQGLPYKTFLLNIDQIPEDVTLIYSTWGNELTFEKIKTYMGECKKIDYLNRCTIVTSSLISQEEYARNNIFSAGHTLWQTMTTVNGINQCLPTNKYALKIRTDYALSKPLMIEFLDFIKDNNQYFCTPNYASCHFHRTFEPSDHLFGMSLDLLRKTFYLAMHKFYTKDREIYCPPEQLFGKCFAASLGIDIDSVDQYKVSEEIIRCCSYELPLNITHDLKEIANENQLTICASCKEKL